MATARNLLGNRWDLAEDEIAPISAAVPVAPPSVRAVRPSAVERAEQLVREAQVLLDQAASGGASYDLRLAQGLAESLMDRLEAISRKR